MGRRKQQIIKEMRLNDIFALGKEFNNVEKSDLLNITNIYNFILRCGIIKCELI